jgi:hypothetical protein
VSGWTDNLSVETLAWTNIQKISPAKSLPFAFQSGTCTPCAAVVRLLEFAGTEPSASGGRHENRGEESVPALAKSG